MKSYTDIEQSKILTKILPLESADMQWIKMSEDDEPDAYRIGILVHPELIDEDDIPCWSLAALLKMLKDYQLFYNGLIVYIDNESYRIDSDNPIDACYEMIIKLKDLNLL